MKYDTTLVFELQVADYLLMKGYKIIRIRENFKDKYKPVYVFEGDIQDALNEALRHYGLK